MRKLYSNIRLAYVLRTDPYLREANVVQSMRMVDAFAGLTPHVLLPVPCGWTDALSTHKTRRLRERLGQYYGLENRFRTVPIVARRVVKRHGGIRLRTYHRRSVDYLARHRPDLIVTRSERAVRLCSRHRLPVIYETHSGPDEIERLAELEALTVSEFVVGVVTIADKLAELYEANGVPPSKLLVLPDGIPQSSLQRRHEDRATARNRLGLDRNTPLVLYAGSLQKHKGISTLIEAARHRPEVQFVLVGPGRESIETLAGSEPLPDNCLLMGHRPPQQIPVFLDAADICVLPNAGNHPSAEYTSPLKLFEYMASGTPIVASAIPAVGKVLDDGHDACLFEPDNAGELAGRIHVLLANPAKGQRLAENARRKAADFTWEQRAAKVLEAFLPRASIF